MAYLNESILELKLQEFYNEPFERNKSVPGSGLRYHKPDFRNDKLKLIVEYDGHHHFTQTKTQYDDYIKTEKYKSMGYRIVRIPYFVQLSKATWNYYFGVSYSIEQAYPHGFIDPKAILPGDFNSLGTSRFLNILHGFLNIKESDGLSVYSHINKSLIDKKNELIGQGYSETLASLAVGSPGNHNF